MKPRLKPTWAQGPKVTLRPESLKVPKEYVALQAKSLKLKVTANVNNSLMEVTGNVAELVEAGARMVMAPSPEFKSPVAWPAPPRPIDE